jgi:hypothetical protein
MNKLLLPLVVALHFSGNIAVAGNWFGAGPWSSGAYYPGGTDGKYQASVSGNNISGVIGFAIREGGPTTLAQQQTTQQGGGEEGVAGATEQAAVLTTQVFDPTQNYFVIFVEGRSYTGLAVGSVNAAANTVTGSLLGSQPEFGFVTNTLPIAFPTPTLITNLVISNTGITNSVVTTNPAGFTQITVTNTITITNVDGSTVSSNEVVVTNIVSSTPQLITNLVPVFVTNTVITSDNFSSIAVDNISATTNTFDPLPIINRGVSGGFSAGIDNNKGLMSFNGTGQISAPSLSQTIDLVTNSTGDVVGGRIVTGTTNFNISGLRTSFSTAFTPAAPTAVGGN